MTDVHRTDDRHVLVADIGNSNVTFGLYAKNRLESVWRISSNRDRTPDEYRVVLSSLLSEVDLRFASLDGVVMASVVPPIRLGLTTALDRENVTVHVLTAESVGIPIGYDPAESLGTDRLANALAAAHKYGKPVIIVDLGTATTVDLLDQQGEFAGGAIAPGIETAMSGLLAGTFQLPRFDMTAPDRAIGKTTDQSLRSGAIFGHAALVDGLIDRFREEMDGEPAIVGTGGLAKVVAPHVKHSMQVDETLTLDGLWLAWTQSSN